jgi:hypothetical protein
LTDRDGKFVLHDVKPGEQRVEITAAGFRGYRADVTFHGADEKDLGLIRLEPGDLIEGEVRDGETGRPISGATVRIVSPAVGAVTTSDDEGVFQLYGDGNVAQQIEAVAAGYAPSRRVLPGGVKQAMAELLLNAPGQLEVTAWDDTGDKPCGGCTIVVSGEVATASRLADSIGLARFDDLTPGRYYVTRELIRSSSTYVTVSGGGSTVTADVEPRKLTRVELGVPTSSVRVQLVPSPSAGWQLQASCDSSSRVMSVGPDGVCIVRRKPGEICRLTLIQADRGVSLAVLPAKTEGDGVTVRLSPAALTARLVRDGGAVAGLGVVLSSPTQAMAAWGKTDANGYVVIPYVSPALYSLRAPGIEPIVIPIGDRNVDLGTISLPTP